MNLVMANNKKETIVKNNKETMVRIGHKKAADKKKKAAAVAMVAADEMMETMVDKDKDMQMKEMVKKTMTMMLMDTKK
ncbi:hypothetical protein AGMMS49571_11290 [Endomicrobiia bacterium]|nr:hypothetical protein AGMMS49571_11290 [Endomicrobiia bacterium]